MCGENFSPAKSVGVRQSPPVHWDTVLILCRVNHIQWNVHHFHMQPARSIKPWYHNTLQTRVVIRPALLAQVWTMCEEKFSPAGSVGMRQSPPPHLDPVLILCGVNHIQQNAHHFHMQQAISSKPSYHNSLHTRAVIEPALLTQVWTMCEKKFSPGQSVLVRQSPPVHWDTVLILCGMDHIQRKAHHFHMQPSRSIEPWYHNTLQTRVFNRAALLTQVW